MCQQVYMKRHCISFDIKVYRILIVILVIIITRYIFTIHAKVCVNSYVSIERSLHFSDKSDFI